MKKVLARLGLILILLIPGVIMFWQVNPFTSITLELNTSGSIYIQWKTTSAHKNSTFEIERSTDHIKWAVIERITPQLTTQFSFLDGHPEKGINYYRIKLIDSTSVQYSNIHSLEIGDEKDCYIWPQPASTVLHVRASFSYGTLEIIDASGRTAQKRSVTGFVTDIPVSQLPAGSYFIRIKSHDRIWLKKFIKQ